MTDTEARLVQSLRSAPGPAGLARLRARLAEQAERDHLVDVAYRVVDSPLGPLLLAATEEGLIRVAYASQDHDQVLSDLAARVSPRVLAAPARLEEATRQIGAYLAGRRRSFDLPLDLRLSGGFRRTVLDQLPAIGYGQTATYAALASAVGSPKAVRAAGSACATNPLPIVLPCHRVIRSDGSTGGYAGGPEAKKKLLALEAGTPGSPGRTRFG